MAEVTPVTPNPQPPLGCQFVTLAGQQWPVTQTGPRQNRIIVPLGFKVLRRLGPIVMTLEGLKSDDPEVRAAAAKKMLVETSFFETEDIDNMTEVLYAAVSRNNKITKDQFLDLEISMQELLIGLPVILSLAGLEVKKKEAVAPGEEEAKSQTGTI